MLTSNDVHNQFSFNNCSIGYGLYIIIVFLNTSKQCNTVFNTILYKCYVDYDTM